MDERQKQVRGLIFKQACIGIIMVMIALAALIDFDIIQMEKYMGMSDLLINLCVLVVTYISCACIWQDAYFGVFSGHQMKTCLVVISIAAVSLDVLNIFHIIQGDALSPISLSTLLMGNAVMISLWCKRSSW